MHPSNPQNNGKIVYPVTTATLTTILSFVVVHLDMSDHNKLTLMGFAAPIALVANLLVLWGEPKLYYGRLTQKINRDRTLIAEAEQTRDRAMASPLYTDEFKASTRRTCELMTRNYMNDLAELQSRSREVNVLVIFQDLVTRTRDE